MTQEDQHSLIGRLYSDKQNTANALRLGKARAYEIGQELVRLGNQLMRAPETVQFEGQSADIRFCLSGSTQAFTLKGVDVPKMIELTDDIRNKSIHLMDVREAVRIVAYPSLAVDAKRP